MEEKTRSNTKIYAAAIAGLFVCVVAAYAIITNFSKEGDENTAPESSLNQSAQNDASTDNQNNPQSIAVGEPNPSTPNTTDTTTDNTPANPQPTLPSTPQSEYKNGNYTASGFYISPASSSESVTVNLTLQDDVVTALSVQGNADNSTSKKYQAFFIQGISGEVIGKNINDVNPSRVNGSSLTPRGFNQAISTIKADAMN